MSNAKKAARIVQKRASVPYMQARQAVLDTRALPDFAARREGIEGKHHDVLAEVTLRVWEFDG